MIGIIFLAARIFISIILVSFLLTFILSDQTLEKIPFGKTLQTYAKPITDDVQSFFTRIWNSFMNWLNETFQSFIRDMFKGAEEKTQAAAGGAVEGIFNKFLPGFMEDDTDLEHEDEDVSATAE